MREAGEHRRRMRRSPGGGISQRPWRKIVNHLPPTELLSADQIEKIHDSSLRLLEEIGIEFLHPEAMAILQKAGAVVTPGSAQVKFDRGLVLEMIAKAPRTVTLHARNPAHNLEVGGNVVNFATVASAPNAHDRAGGRRSGNFQDYLNFLKLGQSLNCIHLYGGYPVEPVDLPPQTRHLDCLAAFVTHADKPFHAYSLGHARITDGIEIARIARGISAEQLRREPSLFTIVNSNSPLRLDGPMLEGIMAMARAGQLMVLTPFTLAGAMAPATIAGALTLQNAEALAGITFAQMVAAGAPCAYGGFTSNVDMKSGAPAFGTPEYVKATLAGGQLARRYGLPYRSSNANAANTLDAQAAYESMMSLQAAVMSHANIVMHAAGWMEGGLVASFEKMILDAELIQMMAETVEPLVVDDDTIGLEAIREVGPGGHFFGSAHTLARYETAFYPPIVSDWRNSKQWADAGSPTAYDRCEKLVGQVLEAFQPPPLDPGIAEELEAFVARRKSEGGAPG